MRSPRQSSGGPAPGVFAGLFVWPPVSASKIVGIPKGQNHAPTAGGTGGIGRLVHPAHPIRVPDRRASRATERRLSLTASACTLDVFAGSCERGEPWRQESSSLRCSCSS